MTAHVVSVSSGTGSAYLWELVMQSPAPGDTVVAVFADVNGEHPDNYRFLDETHRLISGDLVRLDNGGRTIWDVMVERRFLANTRVDVCSEELKRKAVLRWLEAECDPADTVLHVGIDHSELPRWVGRERKGKHVPGIRERYTEQGWRAEALLADRELTKLDALAWLARVGIDPPLLTRLGFSHANCGGGCVKAGAKQFKRLLRVLPEWFAWWEAGEERVRTVVGDFAILRDRRGGGLRPLTLRELRERVEAEGAANPTLFDDDDRDACGCFTFDDLDAA